MSCTRDQSESSAEPPIAIPATAAGMASFAASRTASRVMARTRGPVMGTEPRESDAPGARSCASVVMGSAGITKQTLTASDSAPFMTASRASPCRDQDSQGQRVSPFRGSLLHYVVSVNRHTAGKRPVVLQFQPQRTAHACEQPNPCAEHDRVYFDDELVDLGEERSGQA